MMDAMDDPSRNATRDDAPDAATAPNDGAGSTPHAPVILPSLETPTLTKAELAELLFERIGLNKRESKDLVEAFFDLLHEALVHGREVKLSGFGNFTIRGKASR